METLATGTRGEDIFITVKNACIRSGLDLKYLRGICTNGAPAMTGNQPGFVTKFLDYVSNKYDSKKTHRSSLHYPPGSTMCQIHCFKYHSEGCESHYLVYSRKCFVSSTISRNFILK